jgi:hypothetical protein
MTRKLLFLAFLLTLALTFISVNHQLTNASPNMAPPPRHAPPIEGVKKAADATWQVVAGGGGKDIGLNDVSMVSPTEGWAVGSTYSSYGVIMHYTNTTWSLVDVPTGTYSLRAIEMISLTEGWAVGALMCQGCISETVSRDVRAYTANSLPDIF